MLIESLHRPLNHPAFDLQRRVEAAAVVTGAYAGQYLRKHWTSMFRASREALARNRR
jgi:fatty-acid desaturase